MATKEQSRQFCRAFIEIAENVRSAQPLYSENSKKFFALKNIRDFENYNGRQITITDISKISGMAVSNVSRYLRPLEESGYIERQRIGRTVYIHVTADGDQILASNFDDISGYLSDMLNALTDEELTVFLQCSEKIAAALHNNKKENKKGDLIKGVKDV